MLRICDGVVQLATGKFWALVIFITLPDEDAFHLPIFTCVCHRFVIRCKRSILHTRPPPIRSHFSNGNTRMKRKIHGTLFEINKNRIATISGKSANSMETVSEKCYCSWTTKKTNRQKVNKINRETNSKCKENRDRCVFEVCVCGRKTAQSDILISVDLTTEIVRDKFEISSIYGCSLRHRNQQQRQFEFIYDFCFEHFSLCLNKVNAITLSRSLDAIFRLILFLQNVLRSKSIERYTAHA